jgi:uncharacterized phage protein (TIGR01671 family)
MREILFRGKRIDNGEWVYSQTVFSHLDNFYIPAQNLKCTVMRSLDTVGNISEIRCKDGKCFFRVQTETIGQFTGLTDKNGAKIFEGDIVDCLDYLGEVYYDPDGCYDLRDNTGEMRGDFIGTCYSREVIGNIHDNPELLEVKK